MMETIAAVGRGTPPVRTTSDVFATDGNGGKAEQTAAAKPSLVVTQGARNRTASVFEKAEPKAVRLDERLRHEESAIPAGELLGENNVHQLV